MPLGDPRTTKVVFCGKTSLEIARAAKAKRCELATCSMRTPPADAPRQEEVFSAIERVEAAFKGLHLERPVQLLVGERAHCKLEGHYISHCCSGSFSRNSVYKLDEGVYACSPALSFLRLASWDASAVTLLELGFELCGTYCTEATCAGSGYNREPLTTVRSLRDYARSNESLRGAASVLRLVPYLADGSASPRETKMALLFGLPRRKGGGGLGIPRMNYEVEASREASLLSGKRSFRCDLCWPEAKLDVEYQSRAIHSNEASRIDDSRRANALRTMGWEVISVTNEELDSISSTDVIMATIGEYLGKDQRNRTRNLRERRMALRSELALPLEP